jgi:hypothetical protein
LKKSATVLRYYFGSLCKEFEWRDWKTFVIDLAFGCESRSSNLNSNGVWREVLPFELVNQCLQVVGQAKQEIEGQLIKVLWQNREEFAAVIRIHEHIVGIVIVSVFRSGVSVSEESAKEEKKKRREIICSYNEW